MPLERGMAREMTRALAVAEVREGIITVLRGVGGGVRKAIQALGLSADAQRSDPELAHAESHSHSSLGSWALCLIEHTVDKPSLFRTLLSL
jgi:hypothetical protein